MAGNAINWPSAVFPRSAMFHPENQSKSGGVSLTGSEQVTISNSGRWRAKATSPIMTEQSVLAWRAFVSLMEGRAGTVLVPKWDNYSIRDMNGRQFSEVGGATYEDGTLNFDLSEFGQSDLTHATLAASAALNATRLSVSVTDGAGPRPGQYISIGQRLYMVQLAWEEDEGDPLQLQIWPRLRSAAASGARVVLDRPQCLMRFANDQTGELELDYGRWGSGGLDMVEAI
ncbi:MAG: hypothetical protein ACOH2M_08805 [Cypionkella sp.]